MNCARRPTTYWTTCGCPDCVIDRRRKRKAFSTGAAWRIPQERAEKVLLERLDDGWTSMALASATELRASFFQRHVTAYKRGQPMLNIGPIVAAAIVTMGTPTQGQIGSTGSRRRLQALARLGHSLTVVGNETGINFSTLAMIRNGQTDRIKATSATSIRAMYETTSDTLGGSWIVRRDAEAKGWLPTAAWDDIDNPNGSYVDTKISVDPVVVDRILAGDMTLARTATKAERVAVVTRWRAGGRSLNELDQLAGWQSRRYLEGEVAA